MRALLLTSLACLLLSSGCSAVRLGLGALGTPIGNGFHDEVTPIGPVEQQLEVVLSPRAPVPDELAPPAEPAPERALPPPPEVPPPGVEVPVAPAPKAPAPVPVEPAPTGPDPNPLVGPPLGTAPLTLYCTVEQRAEREEVRTRWVEWDIGEKLVYTLVALFDTTLVGVVTYELWNEPSREPADTAFGVALASVAALDAAVLWGIVLFMPPTWRELEREQEGIWRDQGGACPTGLVLERAGYALPVDAHGRLSEQDEAWLVRDLVERGGAVTVRLSGHAQEIAIPALERCRFAEERGLPLPALCPAPPTGPEPVLRVRLPLP